ncbi:hypothetical protein ABZ807_09325 [Micromonospora sp. NPDC047548]|uniref:hypothetical protein n=1 Tax=Micromonospora sp. NPDC047548 TaxID=3155624 RepID=UPI0033EAAC3B
MNQQTTRPGIIAGLRALADFHEANPDVPFSVAADFTYCVLADNDADGLAEVRRVAELLGAEVNINAGSADAKRMFEGLPFRVFYVSRQRSADWQALTSYDQNVTADQAVEQPAGV